MDGIGLIATLCCAALGGWAGRRFRLPMGALTGALLAVMTLNLVLERAVFPKCLLTPMQIVTGAIDVYKRQPGHRVYRSGHRQYRGRLRLGRSFLRD